MSILVGLNDIQDPFLVSVHIITDLGNGQVLQKAIDSVLAWIHPDLKLFRVSERGYWKKPKKSRYEIVIQPALAVILFLQEDYGEQQIIKLHQSLQKPPWQYHHTESVNGHMLPYMACNQDYFILSSGTPLWAIRQVHYGKEIVRFTIYCSHNNFLDMVKMYQLILKRSVSQKKGDFCFFIVYSNIDTEIQLSLKRLPKGQYPTPTEYAIVEFRVKSIGELVPMLPNPCTPISDVRWQTVDYDGNQILLQHHNYCNTDHFTHLSYRNRRYQKGTTSSRSRQHLRHSQQDLSSYYQGDSTSRRSSSSSETSLSAQRSRSLYCLPSAIDSTSFTSSVLSRAVSDRNISFSVFTDDLDNAEETDVDTGLKMRSSDMTVVSGYSRLGDPFQGCSKTLPSQARLQSMMKNPVPSFSQLSCGSLPSLTDILHASPSSRDLWPTSVYQHKLTTSVTQRHPKDHRHSKKTDTTSFLYHDNFRNLPQEDLELEFYI
uniref:Family with sequence similarity 124 member A n=1 Tax=Erpetoichthys calabaricus TaxID=27687 RepID=A0A8C4RWV8_ERPCA